MLASELIDELKYFVDMYGDRCVIHWTPDGVSILGVFITQDSNGDDVLVVE